MCCTWQVVQVVGSHIFFEGEAKCATVMTVYVFTKCSVDSDREAEMQQKMFALIRFRRCLHLCLSQMVQIAMYNVRKQFGQNMYVICLMCLFQVILSWNVCLYLSHLCFFTITHTYIHICKYIYIFIFICVYVYIYIYTYVYIKYVYIYIYVFIKYVYT